MQAQLETTELIDLGAATETTLGIPWVPAFEDVMGEDHRD